MEYNLAVGDISDVRTERTFTVTVPTEDIADALLYYVAKHADLPPCQFRGKSTLIFKNDGTVEAVVEVTWWPRESEVLTDGA